MKKKKPKRRNGIAKALESPSFKHRVIPDKRKKKLVRKTKEEMAEDINKMFDGLLNNWKDY